MRLIPLLSLMLMTANSQAINYNVTTTDDVFDLSDCNNPSSTGSDGLLSLREAVCLANISKGADVVLLPDGDYALNLGSIGDDLNTEGDLDINDTLHIIANSSAIIRNGYGLANVDGDGDRLFDVLGNENNAINLTLQNLTLQDADVGCTAIDCISGAAVVNFNGQGVLNLTNTQIQNNQNSCQGDACGDRSNAAVFNMQLGGELNLLNTTISDNRTFCQPDTLPARRGLSGTPPCTAGVNVLNVDVSVKALVSFKLTAVQSQINNNHSYCHFDYCAVENIIQLNGNLNYSDLNMSQFSLTNNSLYCQGIDCSVGSLLRTSANQSQWIAQDTLINNNSLSCLGDSCDTDYLIRIENNLSNPNRGDSLPDAISIDNSQFNNNIITCTGLDCSTDEILLIDESSEVSLLNSTIQYNQQTCYGDECGTDELLEICCDVGNQTISNTVISNNLHYCEGNGCELDEIVDIGSNQDNVLVQVINSQIIDNQAVCVGDGCSCDVAGIYFRGNYADNNNTVDNSTIARNVSSGDDSDCLNRATGGIRNGSKNLLITNTTIHGNQTVGSGAGILNSGNVILDHVTITDNQADLDNNGIGFGSGICNNFQFMGVDSCGIDDNTDGSPTIQMSNTILSNQDTQAPDCYGLFESNGFNVINSDNNCTISGDYTVADPVMRPLADNGCTQTMGDGSCVHTQLVEEISPTIDAGSCFSGQITDQRGVTRPFDVTAVADADDGCDIGAVENFSDLIFINGFED